MKDVKVATGDRLHLRFRASVQDGEGAFGKIRFPGRTEMLESPLCTDGAENFRPSADWPEELCPGSMNCRVIQFPENFSEIVGKGDRIAALDHTHKFKPEFCIPKDAIENNRVGRFRILIFQGWALLRLGNVLLQMKIQGSSLAHGTFAELMEHTPFPRYYRINVR